MKKRVLFFILTGFLLFSSCDDLFEPAIENHKDVNQMYTDASYAQGFLVNVYRSIPDCYDNSEYATDDAVTNQLSNGFLNMATGAWTSINNPVNQWTGCYGAIQYLNLFLANADKVNWADDEEASNLFCIRMKGEAYGLRAMFMYYLLRAHAGFTEDGQLLGVPIFTEFQDVQTDFNQPRATFQACIQQIYDDLDKAEEALPIEYNDINSDEEIPERFRSVTTRYEVYNRVMGHYARQLFNGLIAKSYRVRTALLAASPAFNASNNKDAWEDVANYAAEILDYFGSPEDLDPTGVTFYTNADIPNLNEGVNPKEIIWRKALSTQNNEQEAQNYPPSLFGTGYMNPTQNLVDAFPTANGYPITDKRGSYDITNPYTNRDPRLALYIIYNGSTAGPSNQQIFTNSQLKTDDGINSLPTSTRTGYYMRKRLQMSVNCNPSSTIKTTHYTPRIRYTEIFLSYAEAANEAWGPKKGSAEYNYSALDVIRSIRKRAGITDETYLNECAESVDKMRVLIRNERRLELCFEGFRFWDLRRWKADLNETARGIDIKDGRYTSFDVENRKYEDYMYYGPIPYSEVQKYDKLIQNKGWK